MTTLPIAVHSAEISNAVIDGIHYVRCRVADQEGAAAADLVFTAPAFAAFADRLKRAADDLGVEPAPPPRPN